MPEEPEAHAIPISPHARKSRPSPPQSTPVPTRFHDTLGARSRLTDRRRLSLFLDGLVRQHKPAVRYVSLAVIFCTDEGLAEMNVQFLDHDTYTDILTFDLSETPAETIGELYISTDRVADNARTHGQPYRHELHRVIFHGVLHLCGFGDKTDEEIAAMRAAETTCLEAYLDLPPSAA